MIFSREGDLEKQIDDFGLVKESFQGLAEDEFFTFQLTNTEEEYIRCIGISDQLMVEYSQKGKDGLTRFVLGVSKEDRSPMTFLVKEKSIPLYKNELLMIEDAAICFEAFFNKQDLPNAFNQREVSS